MKSTDKLIACCLLLHLMDTTFATIDTFTVATKVKRLFQHEQASELLTEVTCTTNPVGNGCVVAIDSMEPTRPCDRCFAVYPCRGIFCLRFLPSQGTLNPAIAAQYIITLKATDLVDGGTKEQIVDIRIITNSPPYFSSADMFENIDLSSRNIDAGDSLYTVKAEDDDEDTLTYSMVTRPDTDGVIVLDPLSGIIRTTKDLWRLCITDVTAMVTVKDPYNDPVGTFSVNLEFTGPNRAPLVTNVDREILVREDAAVDSIVHVLNAVDDRAFDDVVFTYSFIPTSAENLFYITGKNLRVKSLLDYEEGPRTITMKLVASDGFCSSEEYSVTLRIVDINEPPVVVPNDLTMSTCEGWVKVLPPWSVSDPDEDDSVVFSDIVPNLTGRFAIHNRTGVVSTMIDFDIDKQSSLPTSVTKEIIIKDQQHLSATATLTLRFVDCNDNAPIFDKASKVQEVEDCTPIGTIVTNVPKAEDDDSDFQKNNVISYSGSSARIRVDPSGGLVLTGTFQAGEFETFPVYAKDQGENPGPLTSENPVWISVYGVPCSAPVTPDPDDDATDEETTLSMELENEVDFWGGNEIWVLTAAVVGSAFVILMMFMFFRYCLRRCRQSCNNTGSHGSPRHGHDPQPTSRSPAQRPSDLSPAYSQQPSNSQSPQPGSLFGFYKEQYNDTDYDKPPIRNALPAPSQGLYSGSTNTYDTGPIRT